jgi:oxygen-independent coproporphyrinogen-3 oxidase
VQSFFEEDLQWMNRAHNAVDVTRSLQQAKQAGFDNLNIDLIYGLPEMNNERWKKNLETFFSYNIPHLSAYCLTVEPKTALESMIQKGKKKPMNEKSAHVHFEILADAMEAHRYEHYEISNFALPEKYAVHNSSYWKGAKYLGLGPSAHSYNSVARQWNVSNNIQYIRSLLNEKKLPAESETLTIENQFNEMLMTRLRTIWGLDINVLEKKFSAAMIDKMKAEIQPYLETGALVLENNILKISRSGKFIADKIVSDLMIVED